MPEPIDFYFDFSSPYGYFAAMRIDDLALRHGRKVRWYPYLMGAARSGLALIWKIVLVVELLGRSNGVGFQLNLFFQLFDVASILAYTIAFVVVVQVIELGILLKIRRSKLHRPERASWPTVILALVITFAGLIRPIANQPFQFFQLFVVRWRLHDLVFRDPID